MAYSRVPTYPLDSEERCSTPPTYYPVPRPQSRYRAAFFISLALNIVLFTFTGVRFLGTDTILTGDGNLYFLTAVAPAQSALRHVPRVFDSGFGIQTTPYQGKPTEINNKLWSDLYNFGISRISADEARPMINKTLPIPGDSSHYIISLSVFHQLHCLNQVRKGLYGDVDWTDASDHTGISHLDHCIDMIRQSLMCSVDVTPLTFTRSQDGIAKEVAEVVHQCRDFEAVVEWAKARPMQVEWNNTEVVTDDPLGWGDYHIGY